MNKEHLILELERRIAQELEDLQLLNSYDNELKQIKIVQQKENIQPNIRIPFMNQNEKSIKNNNGKKSSKEKPQKIIDEPLILQIPMDLEQQNNNEDLQNVSIVINDKNSQKQIQQATQFQPLLSKVSLQLASKMGNAMTRLHTTSVIDAQRKKNILKEQLKSSHHPKINNLSVKIDQKNQDSSNLPRWQKLYDMNSKYKQKLIEKQQIQEQQRQIEEKCSFQPNISKKNFSQSTDLDILMRQSYWMDKKNDNLRKIQDEVRNEQMQSFIQVCTFTPHKYTKQQKQFGVTDFNKEGLQNYFLRVEKANDMKQQYQQIKNKSYGENWSNKTTIPETFRFNQQQNKRNKSNESKLYLEQSKNISQIYQDQSFLDLHNQLHSFVL